MPTFGGYHGYVPHAYGARGAVRGSTPSMSPDGGSPAPNSTTSPKGEGDLNWMSGQKAGKKDSTGTVVRTHGSAAQCHINTVCHQGCLTTHKVHIRYLIPTSVWSGEQLTAVNYFNLHMILYVGGVTDMYRTRTL